MVLATLLHIYSKIRIYTARLVYVHQYSYTYIKICVYTSRFVSLNIYQALQKYRNINIGVCTLRPGFVHMHTMKMCRYIKILLYTLRFMKFGHTEKRDRWIDYGVFKRPPKNGSKHGGFVAPKRGSHLLLGSPNLQSHDRRSAS